MKTLENMVVKYFEQKSTGKVSLKELCRKFNIKGEIAISSFFNILNELIKTGKIYVDKNGEYDLLKNNPNLSQGRLFISKSGNGYLLDQDNNNIFIPKNELNGALTDDIVCVRKMGVNMDRIEGKIENIIYRSENSTLFEIKNINNKIILKPLNDNIDINVKIPDSEIKKLNVGDIISVKVTIQKKDDSFIGKMENLVGNINDPDSDLKTIAYSHGFIDDFSKKALKELENIPVDIKNEDLNNRRDLRNTKIFTIDGEDTKDMDDAVSIEIMDNGNYKLGVHIADVAHYVKLNSELFKEAYKRGTSLYLLDSVIPMLPRKLSNGICSLNPLEDRLTKSIEMEIDNNGNIINYEIFRSIINSKKKMTYEDVNKILENNIMIDEYQEFLNDLINMKKLSKILDEARIKRGYLNFSIPDTKIKKYNKKDSIHFYNKEHKTAENIIENFMIMANQQIATHYYWLEEAFIYRNHKAPNKDKMEKVIKAIKNYNINFNNYSQKSIQKLLEIINNTKELKGLSHAILCSMQKAEYSDMNLGHYGLALDIYTHFTSPIRRLPDLVISNLIDIYDKNIELSQNSDLIKFVGSASIQASNREKRAQDAEREAIQMKMAEYMENHIGEELEGTIYLIDEYGMLIQLDNLIVGKVTYKDISDSDHYKYVPNKMALIGNKSKKMYKIGDRIKIKVKSASKKDRTINFIALDHIKEAQTVNDKKSKVKIKKM